MSSKLSTILASVTSIGTIEVVNSIPTDPSFYTELFKLLLQIIIAIVTIFKLLKKQKNEGNDN